MAKKRRKKIISGDFERKTINGMNVIVVPKMVLDGMYKKHERTSLYVKPMEKNS